MLIIYGTTIKLTRGDSLYIQLDLTKNGQPFTPEAGDSIRFAMKKKYTDQQALITKSITNGILHLEPTDTKTLAFGKYVYDIEITYENGDVDTFIKEATFELTPEVI